MRGCILALLLGCFATCTLAASDNAKLQELFEADQLDRSQDHDSVALPARDFQRRKATLEIVKAGQLATSNDYFHAAMVFQHGGTVADIDLAHSLAVIATRMDDSNAGAKWLTAAAWDRLLMRKGKPQWYGTQFVRNDAGQWDLYRIDADAVTDAERLALGARTLEGARAMVKELNAK